MGMKVQESYRISSGDPTSKKKQQHRKEREEQREGN